MRCGASRTDVDGNRLLTKASPTARAWSSAATWTAARSKFWVHNFRNNYEVAVDSFGTLWQSDNDDDGNHGVRINYVMENGNFGYTDEMTGASWGAGWKNAPSQGRVGNRKSGYHWHQHDPGSRAKPAPHRRGFAHRHCVYEGKLLPEAFATR